MKKWILLLLLIGLGIFAFKAHKAIRIAKTVLIPPVLPTTNIKTPPSWLEQNWDEETRQRFHFTSQGTQTLQIPYEWFINLEQPASDLPGLLSATTRKLSDQHYMARMGFIPAATHPKYNPDGLPVGIVKSPSQTLEGLQGKRNAIGLTCAACHTGIVRHKDKVWGIDGGPATTDLGIFNNVLGASLGQTVVSAKLPFFRARFEAFSQGVLGDQYNALTSQSLADELIQFAELAAAAPKDVVKITEGFTRLDALNRIGNQVFGHDAKRPENLAMIDAPVNFPHIWTSSWFDWVQYDGSIMSPLIHNTGEALGVKAGVNFTAAYTAEQKGRFGSAIPMRNLHWLEQTLAGDNINPTRLNAGLKAPKWPEQLGEIDMTLAYDGKKLYEQHCMECHRSELNSARINEWMKPIAWKGKYGEARQTKDNFLEVAIIPLSRIGTDPAQSNVLASRTVNTAGTVDDPSQIDRETKPRAGPMLLDTHICRPPATINAERPFNFGDQRDLPFSDAPDALFAFAWGAVADRTIKAWTDQNLLKHEQIIKLRGDRPNCLQVGAGYKARPLNGIWATAPYLHNGSVASLWDILTPAKQRPALLELGNNTFDSKKVGFKQPDKPKAVAGTNYSVDGTFILDTRIPGNSNAGHDFSAIPGTENDPAERAGWPKGVIGPRFNDEQKTALIEYLKTL